MKTTTLTIPEFPGIVIDPASGRKCATQMAIFRGLGLAGNQIVATGARRYQDQFYDLEDVIIGRSRTRPRGRPRNKKSGIILANMAAIIAASIVGTASSASIIGSFGRDVATPLREAVAHQEANVRMMEELGFSGAKLSRSQWETNKQTTLGRIGELKTITTTQP